MAQSEAAAASGVGLMVISTYPPTLLRPPEGWITSQRDYQVKDDLLGNYLRHYASGAAEIGRARGMVGS